LIDQAMALSSGFSTTLSNSISIRLVLLCLVVLPTTELVLPFDVDRHFSDSHAYPSPSRSRQACPCLSRSCALLQDPISPQRYLLLLDAPLPVDALLPRRLVRL